jgi:signal transduction histidine kinase
MFDLTYELGEGLVSLVASSKKVLVENDLANNPFVKYLNKGEYARRDVNCALFIPLAYEQELQGVLEFASRKPFSYELAEKLQPITRLASRTLYEAHQANAAKRIPDHLVHELRTPLTCVYGYAQLLESEKAHTQDFIQKVIEYTQRILASSQRALDVIEYSRLIGLIERGTLVPERKSVSALSLLEEVLEQFSLETTAQVHVYRPYGYNPKIFVDPHLTGQALTKVIENSFDFALTTIDIRLEKPNPSLDNFSDESMVAIRIRNDGPTITGSQREKIFKKNYTGKKNGTGYGLWHARELVRCNGGELVNVPILGGARFDFYLPLANENVVEDPREEQSVQEFQEDLQIY